MTTKLLQRCRDELTLCLDDEVGTIDALLTDLNAAIAQQAEPVAATDPMCAAMARSQAYRVWENGPPSWVEESHFASAAWALERRNAVPQPPATSGMPEMPEPSFIDGPTEAAYYKDDVASADRTACYAAGRRQGLEEAKAACLCTYPEWVGGAPVVLPCHDTPADCAAAIDALLQTRGKNDSGVV